MQVRKEWSELFKWWEGKKYPANLEFYTQKNYPSEWRRKTFLNKIKEFYCSRLCIVRNVKFFMEKKSKWYDQKLLLHKEEHWRRNKQRQNKYFIFLILNFLILLITIKSNNSNSVLDGNSECTSKMNDSNVVRTGVGIL